LSLKNFCCFIAEFLVPIRLCPNKGKTLPFGKQKFTMASSEMVTATAVILAAYAGLILFFVIRGALRTKSITDYAVGSMHFSPVVVGLSLAASITSAATFIINPGFIALYGLSGILALAVVLPIGLFFSLVFLTRKFRKFGHSVKALTMAQWIGTRYNSKSFALYFGFLSLLLLTFIVLICVGMTKVISNAINVDEMYVLMSLVVFVFGYMMFGGANSMVYTNTIQAVLMLVVAFILLGSGYEHFKNGVNGFLDKLAAIDPALVAASNPSSPLFRDFFEIVICNLIVGIAIVCQPHILTKSLLLKSESDVNKYLITGILVEMIFFAVVIAGLYARLSFPDLMVNGQKINMDSIIPTYVVSEFPVFVGILVIMGLLSAGLSTLEGLIQSLSTTITNDIVAPIGGFDQSSALDAGRLVWINRFVIVILAVTSILITRHQLLHPNLSVGIFAQNGVYAFFSAAFMPVLLGVFRKDTPKVAAVAASLTAVFVHFSVYYGGITPYMQGEVRNPAIAAALAITSSVIIGLVTLYFFSKPLQEKEAAA
jgi:sodium/pantothenate symporter